MFMVSQAPIIGAPLMFLSTWVHELGHGLGALATGAHFEDMIVSPDFSGLARTASVSNLQRISTLLGGLLGPCIAGAVMIIMVRGAGWARLPLGLLTLGLAVSGVLWAGDTFTRSVIAGICVVLAGLTLKGGPRLLDFVAHVIAVSFCISAVTHVSYFFVRSGHVDGRLHQSDTKALAELTGMPHVLWAVILTLLSALILFSALKLAGALNPHNRKPRS